MFTTCCNAAASPLTRLPFYQLPPQERKKPPRGTGWGSPSKTQSLAETALKWRRIGPLSHCTLSKLSFDGAGMWLWPVLPPYVLILPSLSNKLVWAQGPHSCFPASDLQFNDLPGDSADLCLSAHLLLNGFASERICHASVRGELVRNPVKMDCNHCSRRAINFMDST